MIYRILLSKFLASLLVCITDCRKHPKLRKNSCVIFAPSASSNLYNLHSNTPQSTSWNICRFYSSLHHYTQLSYFLLFFLLCQFFYGISQPDGSSTEDRMVIARGNYVLSSLLDRHAFKLKYGKVAHLLLYPYFMVRVFFRLSKNKEFWDYV